MMVSSKFCFCDNFPLLKIMNIGKLATNQIPRLLGIFSVCKCWSAEVGEVFNSTNPIKCSNISGSKSSCSFVGPFP